MISFSCLKFKKLLILYAVIRTADHFCFHCESINSCQGDMAKKKDEVSTEGNDS